MCASCLCRLVQVVPTRLLLWGRRIVGQVGRPLMQSHLFTEKIVSDLLQPALGHNKCSQFCFPKPIPSVLVQAMLVLIFWLSASQAFIYSACGQGKKTDPHHFPPFCLPALVTMLYPQYKFRSNLKYTFKLRQQFKHILAIGQTGQGGQDSSTSLQTFTKQALVSALVTLTPLYSKRRGTNVSGEGFIWPTITVTYYRWD